MGIPNVESGDGSLVRRVLAGDVHAYASLVERHSGKLARYARHALGNREDAEEAVQDAFARAYRSLHRCNDPEGFGPWLFRILVNRCRTRGGQVNRRAKLVVHDDAALTSAVTRDAADESAWREAVQWALARLESHYREAFLLKYVEEMSYEEMVAMTGEGESALKMRVKRACDQLRAMLLAEVERV